MHLSNAKQIRIQAAIMLTAGLVMFLLSAFIHELYLNFVGWLLAIGAMGMAAAGVLVAKLEELIDLAGDWTPCFSCCEKKIRKDMDELSGIGQVVKDSHHYDSQSIGAHVTKGACRGGKTAPQNHYEEDYTHVPREPRQFFQGDITP